MLQTDNTKYDVAIVGAGPAGSALAIRLCTVGLKVLLVEQKRFPRHKLCGEFISPECFPHFENLGLLDQITSAGGTDISETTFFARNGRSARFPSNWFGETSIGAIGLSRAEFDRILIDRAAEVGADIRVETVAVPLINHIDDKVIGVDLNDKTGKKTSVHSKLTIDATGRSRSLARHFEGKPSVSRPADSVAFKTHLRGAQIASGACEIYAYRGGYGGCNKIESDLSNLCFIVSAKDTKRLGSSADRLFREVVCSNSRAAEALNQAHIVTPWLAVPIERLGCGELVPAEGLLSVGDSAAFIDPFTGSGILMALESAEIAGTAILSYFDENVGFDYLAAEYKRSYGARFDSRLRACSVLRRAASVPYLADAAISLLGLSETITRKIARATRSSAKQSA